MAIKIYTGKVIREQSLSSRGPRKGFFYNSAHRTGYAQAILYGLDVECSKSDIPIHLRQAPVQEWCTGNGLYDFD